MTDPQQLQVVSTFKLPENEASFCATVGQAQDNFSSYASHNPTVLPDLALSTWHSGGLQAVDLTNPTQPSQAGYFLAAPETIQAGQVHTPDPALEPGSNGVIAWSYPIIKDGLVYFVDIANGMYVVRYTGPHADEVAGVSFLEGNSNLGDAARLEATGPAAAVAEAPLTGGLIFVGLVALVMLRLRRHPLRPQGLIG